MIGCRASGSMTVRTRPTSPCARSLRSRRRGEAHRLGRRLVGQAGPRSLGPRPLPARDRRAARVPQRLGVERQRDAHERAVDQVLAALIEQLRTREIRRASRSTSPRTPRASRRRSCRGGVCVRSSSSPPARLCRPGGDGARGGEGVHAGPVRLPQNGEVDRAGRNAGSRDRPGRSRRPRGTHARHRRCEAMRTATAAAAIAMALCAMAAQAKVSERPRAS